MDLHQLDLLSVEDLARACAQRASRRGHTAGVGEPDPCYELFRRAFAPAPDADAWSAILEQYRRLVFRWLGQYASEDTVQDVFLRFWKAQQGEVRCFSSRFSNTSATMGFLKRCAVTVRIEAWRAEKREDMLRERLHLVAAVSGSAAQFGAEQSSCDLKQTVLSKLNGEREEVVVELTWCYDLKPGEVQARRPDLFPDVRAVYRVKENLLRRLRRDRELKAYWSGSDDEDAEPGDDAGDDGGKTISSPVY